MENIEYNPNFTVSRITYLLSRQKKMKKDFNDFCGINKSTLNQSAQSKTGLSASTIFRAALFLDCPSDYLLGLKGYQADENGVVIPRTGSLSETESQLLALFRQLPEIEKYKILGRLEVIAEQNQPKQETV